LKKGELFVFEGADAAGKTVHMQEFFEFISKRETTEICSWSTGKRVEGKSPIEWAIKNPSEKSYNSIRKLIGYGFYDKEEGRILTSALLENDKNIRMATLFSVSLAITTRDIINKTILNGSNIICDRFTASTLAYQGLISKDDGSNYMEDTKNILTSTFNNLNIDMPNQTCYYIYIKNDRDRIIRLLSRTDQLDSLDSDMELQKRLSKSYETALNDYSSFLNINKIIKVDNSASINVVQKHIQELYIQDNLEKYKNKPSNVGRL